MIPSSPIPISTVIAAHQRLLDRRLALDSLLRALDELRAQVGFRLAGVTRTPSSILDGVVPVEEQFEARPSHDRATVNMALINPCPLHPYGARNESQRYEEKSNERFEKEEAGGAGTSRQVYYSTPRSMICLREQQQEKRRVRLRIRHTRAKIKKTNLLRKALEQAVAKLTISESMWRDREDLHQRCLALYSVRDLIQRDLRDNQTRLLSQLMRVFPIKSTDDVFTLRGFDVPSVKEFIARLETIPATDFWTIGTSLGLTSHLTQLLSKYLDIPLSKQVGLFSSRSVLHSPSPTAALGNLPLLLVHYNPFVIAPTQNLLPCDRPFGSMTTTPSRPRGSDLLSSLPAEGQGGVLQLFRVLHYGVHHDRRTRLGQVGWDNPREADQRMKSGDMHRSVTLPTPLNLNGILFPLTSVSACFRGRPGTVPCLSLGSALTLDPSGRRSLRLPTGLLWVEPCHQDDSPQSRYSSSGTTLYPPLWKTTRFKLSDVDARNSVATAQRTIEEVYRITASSHPDSSSGQTPCQTVVTSPGPSSTHLPVLTSSSTLPMSQPLPSSDTTFSFLQRSVTSTTAGLSDPISLTLSLLGLGSSTAPSSPRQPPPLPNPVSRFSRLTDPSPDALDSSVLPLFIRSNTAADRQRFTLGLREFSSIIHQLLMACTERIGDDGNNIECSPSEEDHHAASQSQHLRRHHPMESPPVCQILQHVRIVECTPCPDPSPMSLIDSTSLLQPLSTIFARVLNRSGL